MNERPDVNEGTVETKDRTTRGTVEKPRDTSDTFEGFLPDDSMDDYREQWTDIQAGFVDDPRTAVKNAHDLVTDIVGELNETLARERLGLENAWNRGEEADTEDLRVALTRYRSFFNRLLR
jgi:hypothetical protein